MSQPAGWLPDPYGRFAQRYWDGAAFTNRVLTDGKEQVDQLGTTVSVPFATPASALSRPYGLRGVWHRLFHRKH
jgi:Protein of unknown function (DUF2510)